MPRRRHLPSQDFIESLIGGLWVLSISHRGSSTSTAAYLTDATPVRPRAPLRRLSLRDGLGLQREALHDRMEAPEVAHAFGAESRNDAGGNAWDLRGAARAANEIDV